MKLAQDQVLALVVLAVFIAGIAWFVRDGRYAALKALEHPVETPQGA